MDSGRGTNLDGGPCPSVPVTRSPGRRGGQQTRVRGMSQLGIRDGVAFSCPRPVARRRSGLFASLQYGFERQRSDLVPTQLSGGHNLADIWSGTSVANPHSFG